MRSVILRKNGIFFDQSGVIKFFSPFAFIFGQNREKLLRKEKCENIFPEEKQKVPNLVFGI